MIKRIEPGRNMSVAVIRDRLIYFSGLTTEEALEGKLTTISEQALVLCERFEKLLGENGSNKKHILRATIYLKDISLKSEFNEVWGNWIPEGYAPARACVGVELENNVLVKITMIAEIIN